MNKIKKAAIGAALALGVLAGGTAVAAPAQADWGTRVTLDRVPFGSNAWVKARNMNGNDKILHFGETANNAAKVMPPGENWSMFVCGTYSCRTLGYGEAFVFPHDGDFTVALYSRAENLQ